MENANVIFKGYNILKINMEQIDLREKKEKKEKNKFEIVKKSFSSDENANLYKLILEINCTKDDKKINVEVEGYFEFVNINDDEIKKSFLDITAPTVLYPYCRTFVSTIYSMDSKDTVILPIINFANMN